MHPNNKLTETKQKKRKNFFNNSIQNYLKINLMKEMEELYIEAMVL